MRLVPILLCLGIGLAACSHKPELVTLYCYETLADSACYLTPDEGRAKRLLAVVEVELTPELALRRGSEL